MSQAGLGRTSKQEQQYSSPKNVKTIISGSVNVEQILIFCGQPHNVYKSSFLPGLISEMRGGRYSLLLVCFILEVFRRQHITLHVQNAGRGRREQRAVAFAVGGGRGRAGVELFRCATLEHAEFPSQLLRTNVSISDKLTYGSHVIRRGCVERAHRQTRDHATFPTISY